MNRKETICPICLKKPCALNTSTNKYYNTCSLDCNSKLCIICLKKKVATNSEGGFYVTCSMKCDSKLCQVCKKKSKSENPDGGLYPTCSLNCSTKLCNNCKLKPKAKNKIGELYSTCSPSCSSIKKQLSTKNSISFLEKSSKIYEGLEKQFKLKWLKNPTYKRIISISKIEIPEERLKKYLNYRNEVDSKMKKKNIPYFHDLAGPGNELRRFHGTKQKCKIGIPNGGTIKICDNNSNGCNICGIIKHGFLISKCNDNTGWGRFGNGIYLTATSSKSNDYNDETLKFQNFKS